MWIMEKKMETTMIYWSYIYIYICRDDGKENENYYDIVGLYLRIMEKNMDTTMIYIGVI